LNPALSTNLFKAENSIENNALSSLGGVIDSASNELPAGEFSSLLKDIVSANGKLKPLDFSSLKDFNIQQLTELEELSGIKLPSSLLSEAIELQQKQALPLNSMLHDVSDSIEAVNVLGNPDVMTLLKENVIDNDFLESDLLNNQTEKPVAFTKKEITDLIQQLPLKKESGLSHVLNDSEIEFSQQVKTLLTKDIDINNDVLAQTNRQDTNAMKLVEQFANSDKPINAINAINNTSLKTYSNTDQAGTMLNRIEVPVNQAGWGEAVGNRLMMMVNGKVQSANIHLNPAELGPIEIRIKVNQEHATVQFVSNNATVREAIEEAFPRLKDMFSQNGLSLSDANVSQHSSSQHGNSFSNGDSESLSQLNEIEVSDSSDIQSESNKELDSLVIGLVDQYV
jgi:flagellar hook-length control protein FliK